MSEINKKSLEHLANLARLDLTEQEKEKFADDLKKILDHFQELRELDTENVQPMMGGAELNNVLREDEIEENRFTNAAKIVEQFPDRLGGFLKVPPVFE